MTPITIPVLAQALQVCVYYGHVFEFAPMSATSFALCPQAKYRGPVAGDFLLAYDSQAHEETAWRLTWRDHAGKEHERVGSLAEMLGDAHQALHGERLPLRVRTPAQTDSGVTPDGQRWYSRSDG